MEPTEEQMVPAWWPCLPWTEECCEREFRFLAPFFAGVSYHDLRNYFGNPDSLNDFRYPKVSPVPSMAVSTWGAEVGRFLSEIARPVSLGANGYVDPDFSDEELARTLGNEGQDRWGDALCFVDEGHTLRPAPFRCPKQFAEFSLTACPEPSRNLAHVSKVLVRGLGVGPDQAKAVAAIVDAVQARGAKDVLVDLSHNRLLEAERLLDTMRALAVVLRAPAVKHVVITDSGLATQALRPLLFERCLDNEAAPFLKLIWISPENAARPDDAGWADMLCMHKDLIPRVAQAHAAFYGERS